jgi:RNA polymerase sigma factor (sigma-70 family)
MQPTDTSGLLRQYADNESDEAFGALVAQHVDLVYSVAMRHASNPALAEEITQAVFIILAKKARQLRHEKALSSWLFQTTRLTANNFLRSEIRRLRREREAYMQSSLQESGTDIWQRIAPMLDPAVAWLGEKDRRAIILRYYEGKDLRQVGAALGVSDDAAEKRVVRALEKLRRFFSKHGVQATTAAVGAVIAANSVQAAPVALAPAVAAVAVGHGAVISTFSLDLINGTLKAMKLAKAKAAIMLSSAAVLCVTGGIIVVLAQNTPAENQSKAVGSNSVDGSTTTGRHVHASGDVTLGIQVQGDTVTVRLGEPHLDATGNLTVDHILTIEQERVLVDGKEQAKISSLARSLEVACMKRKLSVMADKKLVLMAKLSR